ncbi:hypothetical protein [Ferruginibacter sp. SUN106]|uniref:hypothetical protein n=1 Tax=Ferruginibacter sp. SUN106 TaxID=2978348 RepID=UPI003D35C5E4
MGYINDISRIFILDYDDSKINDKDSGVLRNNFEFLEFRDNQHSYSYDFRFVPTYKLLELKHRIPDLSDNNRRKNPGELLLSDFMTVEEISLLTHFEYGKEKIHGAIDQLKTHQINAYWEFHHFCHSKDIASVTSSLLRFIEANPGVPILTYLEIWDNLDESDKETLKLELKMINLLAEVAARNDLNLLMLSSSDV